MEGNSQVVSPTEHHPLLQNTPEVEYKPAPVLKVDDTPKETTKDYVVQSQPNGKENSLRRNFEAFRERRMKKNQLIVDLRKESTLRRADPGFKEVLRQKFIERAEFYYGTPYAKHFHEPGTEMHNSKLFLDCCALVRRVVWDLREDFGFVLGPFNQNYQFELLPIELKFEEMRPGDLIFYEGTYYPHMAYRKQIHRLVHVEIFIGGESGEQSIGARWNTGVVGLHQSYKFESKNYYDVKHYYRSLDTWLDGICK